MDPPIVERMTTAKALRVHSPGDSSVPVVEQIDVPDPGPGQVRVRVAASGVNFIDTYQRGGMYPVPMPFTLGMEGAGTVESVGADVTDVSVGDRVAWCMELGSCAELALLPADRVVPVPEGVELQTAAAAMLQGMTAHFLVTDCHPVTATSTVLVHAAAGGVGQLLVQLAKEAGATVVATAGSPEKCATARERGADHVVDYSQTDDLAAAVREVVPDGCDVVYDGVGRSTFDASLASLRPRGLMVLFGAASGAVPPFDPQRLNQGGSLYLTRPSLGAYIATPEELRARAGAVLDAVREGRLDITIDSTYGLDDARAGYDALEGRATQGKVLLLP